MRISFIASIRGKKFYNKYYSDIIDYLTNEGHRVDHALSVSEEEILNLSISQRMKYFSTFYKSITKADLVIAECSFPSINVAHEISYATQQGKFIIALYLKNEKDLLFEIRDPIFSSNNILTYEYTDNDLILTLKLALKGISPQLDKRFTLILSSNIMSKLEKISKDKKIPKAVYIRQLIEKALSREKIQ